MHTYMHVTRTHAHAHTRGWRQLMFWDLRAKKEDKSGAMLWTPLYFIKMVSCR
jgi:hypothetical protein